MTLRDTTPLHTQQYRTRQYGTRQRIARMTPHRNDCNCTTLMTRQHKYNSITLQLASNLLFACLAALLAASLLAVVWHSSGPRAASQSQKTMAVKVKSGPRPAAQRAKRCFLNCPNLQSKTSFKPSICLPSCTAGCQLACFRLAQLGSQGGAAEPKHNGSEGRIGPAAGSPEGQTLLSELPRN